MKKRTLFAVAGAIALVTAAFLKRKEIADFFRKNIRIVELEPDGVDYNNTPEDDAAAAAEAEAQSQAQATEKEAQLQPQPAETEAQPTQPEAQTQPQTQEEYNVFRDDNGALGVKKRQEIVIRPKKNYTDIRVIQGTIIITDSGNNDRLVTPGETLRFPCGAIKEHENYLLGRRKGVNWIYVPSNKTLCKAHAYAVSAVGDVITHYKGHVSIYKGGACVVKAASGFRRVAMLPDGHLLVFKEKFWEKASIKDGNITTKGAASTKEIKGWKNSSGWTDDSPVMILT